MTRTLQMDHVRFEIFSDLDYRGENGTLVAHVPDADFANLRCSVSSLFRNGVEVVAVAEREIPELAIKAGTTHEVVGDKLVLRTQRASSQDPESTVTFGMLAWEGISRCCLCLLTTVILKIHERNTSLIALPCWSNR